MSATTQAPIIPVNSTSEPPAVVVPGLDVFSRRAARFQQLADGHALGDWLRFLGHLSHAQHAALQALPAIALPDAAALARAREHRMPPLPALSWPRDPAWHASARQIAAALLPHAPDVAQADIRRLAALSGEALDALAERVLLTELSGSETALLPYVAAALQVLWTAGASRLGATGIAILDTPGVCPCCGFLPVASVVQNVGGVDGLRYLHCALCNTQWNLVRVKCAACDTTEGIGYRQLEGKGAANPAVVRAETCESCRGYLKIVYRQQAPDGDPVADDLATLALDILVDEAGYSRTGPNLFFVPGA
jgi:FdhE protein